jgi:uncharacterized repeat protein (TIGR01451 family)
MYAGSVPDVHLNCAAPDPGYRCQAPARQAIYRLRRGRSPSVALMLLMAAVAWAGGRPVLAATGPTADIVVTMTATPIFVPVGGEINYRMAVTNQGPDIATNIILRDPLPQGLVFIAASASKGSAFLSLRTLVAQLGALDVGDTAVVTLVVTATVAGNFRNGVAVNSDTQDPNLDNNVAFYPASAGPPPPPPPTPPAPPPVPPCAVDQTSGIMVVPGLLEYNPTTRLFHIQVGVANVSKQPITGPVWLVLDDLAPIVLTNADGVTACQPPLGSPYLQINVGSAGVLQPQQVATATLSFAIPAGHGLRYHARVLTGTNPR